ncbi:MAG: hypothetical protein ACRD22_15540 [Terriglobia bacterium]
MNSKKTSQRIFMVNRVSVKEIKMDFMAGGMQAVSGAAGPGCRELPEVTR